MADRRCIRQGFWLLSMGMICFIFLICATRTNIVFVVIFLSLILNFSLLVGARFALAADFSGNAAIANRCTVVSPRQWNRERAVGRLADCSCYLGRRSLCLCDMHGWLVFVDGHHARHCRLSNPDPSGRFEHRYQGTQCEDGQGLRCLHYTGHLRIGGRGI